MTHQEALKILDAIAEGLDPDTGKPLPEGDSSNKRSVIRALQIAIESLRYTIADTKPMQATAKEDAAEDLKLTEFLSEEKMFGYLAHFKANDYNPTPSRVAKCLTGTQTKSIYERVHTYPFYGVLSRKIGYNQVKQTVNVFFEKYEPIIEINYAVNEAPWEEVDFFEQEIFNQLSQKQFQQFCDAVNRIPLSKNHSQISSGLIIEARKEYNRAYEPWGEEENQLLLNTLRYTNDTKLLTIIFQRGERAVKMQGQRLLYYLEQSIKQPLRGR